MSFAVSNFLYQEDLLDTFSELSWLIVIVFSISHFPLKHLLSNHKYHSDSQIPNLVISFSLNFSKGRQSQDQNTVNSCYKILSRLFYGKVLKHFKQNCHQKRHKVDFSKAFLDSYFLSHLNISCSNDTHFSRFITNYIPHRVWSTRMINSWEIVEYPCSVSCFIYIYPICPHNSDILNTFLTVECGQVSKYRNIQSGKPLLASKFQIEVSNCFDIFA